MTKQVLEPLRLGLYNFCMDLDLCFQKAVKDNGDFAEAIEIAKNAANGGDIWVIGGSVFRNIIKELYDSKGPSNYDFDFIFENPVNVDYLKSLKNWNFLKTGLDEPCLIANEKQIDFIWLNNAVNPHEMADPKKMSVDEKIQSYLRRVPLNIQSIIYDVNGDRVIGEVGIKAVKEKNISINNLDECLNFCRRRKISIRKFMTTKGNDLGFCIDYPILNEEIKTNTIDFYDTYSKEYTNERGSVEDSFIEQYLGNEARLLLKNIKGKKVIDIGSGPGRDALYFKSKGLEVECIDASSEMVKICHEKDLEAVRMDIESMDFANSSFDAVWAYASLVHIPKKRIYNTLARISEMLKPEGLFFVGMVEGADEHLHKSVNKPAKKRFFALYQDAEFKEILGDYFDLITNKKLTMPNGEKYLNYLCRKKKDNRYKRKG